jgi:molybdopterin-synthase adenylyltransferase
MSYAERTGRNIGFVTEAEQERLRLGSAFVCGVGGMGGACLLALARAGVGRLVIADIDRFETSNLNRQAFAFLDTMGELKAEAAAAALSRIDPHLQVEVLGADWTREAARLVGETDVTVNGTDDLAASLLLYRTARERGRTVVDAYAAPLPSVYVTRAGDPMPEERLDYPTVGTAWDAVTDEQRRGAFLREAEHVLLNSSTRRHIDLALAAEVAAGKRPRPSFAPMVTLTGQLMAAEAINAVIGRRHGADHRGWFLDASRGKVEHPWGPLMTALLRPVVRRAIRRLTA